MTEKDMEVSHNEENSDFGRVRLASTDGLIFLDQEPAKTGRETDARSVLLFRIRDKEGKLLGDIQLATEKDGVGQIVYKVNNQAENLGYGTTALETLSDYAFNVGNFKILYSDVSHKDLSHERDLMLAGFVDYEKVDIGERFYIYSDYIKVKRTQLETDYLKLARRSASFQKALQGALQVLEEVGVGEIMVIHSRFKRPKNFNKISWDEDRVRRLTEIFEELPRYIDSCQKAGMKDDASMDLLFTLLAASTYDFEDDEVNMHIMGRILGQMAEEGKHLTPLELRKIKTMIKLGGKDGTIHQYLYAFELADRVGLPATDAASIVSHFSTDDVWVHPAYAISHFNEVLGSLKVSRFTQGTVKNVFSAIEKMPRHERGTAYDLLKEVIVNFCPGFRVTPQELLEGYLKSASRKGIAGYLSGFAESGKKKLPGGDMQIETAKESLERYFIRKEGKLEHAAQPYQIKRSFDAGISDLSQLADAQIHFWEEVAEGFWVFDKGLSTWFSYGGSTKYEGGKIRHNMAPYDMSELSKFPIMFHVHPREYESLLRNPYDDFPSREYRNHVTKFLSSTPSRADYGVIADLLKMAKRPIESARSLIVHSLGITEFTYPMDVSKLENMAQFSREIRDNVMLEYPWADLMRQKTTLDETVVVMGLIEKLNAALPEGFSIKFYPRGVPYPKL